MAWITPTGLSGMEVNVEEIRRVHLSELLGKREMTHFQNAEELRQFVREQVEHELKDELKHFSKEITEAVIRESVRNRFDPIFLLSVIKRESRFNPMAIGSVGEIGLMQIRPSTAQWIANKIGIQWNGASDLKDPAKNIRIGATYLAYLRKKFEQDGKLYLAAYNMGATNVYRMLASQITPKIYAKAVMSFYLDFYSRR